MLVTVLEVDATNPNNPGTSSGTNQEEEDKTKKDTLADNEVINPTMNEKKYMAVKGIKIHKMTFHISV
jgi:hypothetical protein